MEKFKVTFYPDKKTVQIDKGKTIITAAISANIYINSSCGGDGVCGRCKVILKKGEVISQPSGRLSSEQRKKGYYLACQALVQSDLEVLIPPESRLEAEKLPQEEIDLRLKGLYSKAEEVESAAPVLREKVFVHSPLSTKLYLELPLPNHTDRISDLERLYRQIRRVYNIPIMQTGLANIRKLGSLLRFSDWRVTVTLGKRNDTTEIVLVEPGDTSNKNYGFCFDIGTTTISSQLVDLNSKRVLGTKAVYNKQASFGSDIITRIIFAREEDGLEKLHHAVIDMMNTMIQELTAENSVDLNDVNCVLCAGNTTMAHLLLRVDPTYIRREPYVSTANFVPTIRASEAGIRINPRGLLSCVPGVSSYLGGDICAGVLSCGMDEEEQLCLLIDIGTNGEIVFGNKEFLIGAAASAGPAFEGSGLSCGMRASKGAIQKIRVNPDGFGVNFSVIGDVPGAIGICGSGYIDLISQLLKAGLIDKEGKFNELKCPRLRMGDSGYEFVIAYAKEAGLNSDIVITEADIENLKRAKAAIFAAASILVRQMNLSFADIGKIFVAGGFGTYIDIENAITIGILPDIDRKKFIFVGNSSLAGAREALLSYDAMKKIEDIAKKITYFELSVESAYMDEYMSAMFFPHTEKTRFPSVKL
ncbi:MAG: ASKHA domain-containing protein [Candidatus Omnitrophota bacterium]